ncbi:MAG: BREX-1 system adenine-specific DNA-methyltransferase PglX [bacterium]
MRADSLPADRDLQNALITQTKTISSSLTPNPCTLTPDFLRISSPEEIKLCDPACGSAHMLVYAFELLYLIYEEEGYEPTEIPNKILTKNLFGIEIDERAGELSAFALTMVAREKYSRFFKKPIQPNICVLEKIDFTTARDPKSSKNDLFSNVKWEDKGWEKILDELCKGGIRRDDLLHDLNLFAEADNFGSLVQPRLSPVQLKEASAEAITLHETHIQEAFLSALTEGVLKALRQAEYLSKRYHVVVTNPPYMGGKGMNDRLKSFLQEKYPDVKSDVFSAFVVRNTELAMDKGQLGFMTPFVWMFISSYEELRNFLIEKKTITSLIQLEYSGFEGATVPICTFTIQNSHDPRFKGGYVRLSDFRGADIQAPKALEAIRNHKCGWFYRTSSSKFVKIPGSPIAYWVSEKFLECFSNNEPIGGIIELKAGMSTGDNTVFQRIWHEVAQNSIGLSSKSLEETETNGLKWYPCHSGGEYRKWFGNHSIVVNWWKNGQEIRNYSFEDGRPRSAVRNESYYFREGITWSKISSGKFAARCRPVGFLFDDTGRCGFSEDNVCLRYTLGLFCSVLANEFLRVLCPTLSFTSGELAKIPYGVFSSQNTLKAIDRLIGLSQVDWNSYETSWEFAHLSILDPAQHQYTLNAAYTKLRANCKEMTLEMQRLEKENNRFYIDAYGLQDELSPDVPLPEITLTCNPYYRYGGDKTEQELEDLLLADTMKEFFSYAVGCMLGRYSLDKPGIILANQGETLQDYLKQIPKPTFMPDEDNIIPILEDEYFTDDIVGRFKEFLKVTFGTEHYDENLKFIEDAIGKDIRKYFVKDFYNDHVKRYKKRPIYWMFSSPKRTFNVLIYMHRYRPDIVSKILNDYLRAFIGKLEANRQSFSKIKISENASPRERTQADKKIADIELMLKELKAYEKTLYEVAAKKIEIDLDDGVKVNYIKFKEVLYPIKGLEKEEE